MALPELRRFELGRFPLEHGGALESAVLTYRTWGEPGAPAILLPSHYTGTSASPARLIGAGRVLDPARYFIIATDLFGNGNSTSPSHLAGAARRAFPLVSVADNVRAQRRLLDALGVGRLALIQGWSLSAIQAWHWAAIHPERVAAILPVCGASGCWPLNRVFLSGLHQVLATDPAFADAPPGAGNAPAGLAAFGRVYAGWAYSSAFWREGLWRRLGHADRDSLLTWWEEDHLGWDAHDLAATLRTWEDADVARAAAAPDLETALSGVRARVIAMPCTTDRYFTPEENEIEVAATPGAALRPIASPYGHCAGGPGYFAQETAQVEAAARELLAMGAP